LKFAMKPPEKKRTNMTDDFVFKVIAPDGVYSRSVNFSEQGRF
jgi:hypothetical protein